MKAPAYIIVLCLVLASPGWRAQVEKEEIEVGLVEVTLGLGVNSTGPAKQLADHMIANGFGQTRTDWWGTFSHPNYQTPGLNLPFTVAYKYGYKSRVGLLYSISSYGDVDGYAIEDNEGLDLIIDLESRALIPYYAIQLDVFQFKGGIGLMSNKSVQYIYQEENQGYANTDIAYMIGMDAYIFDRPMFILSLNSQYIYSSPSKIGIFTAEEDGTIKALPPTEIGFGHFTFALSIGFRLGTKQN